jgi:acetolactate synthase-1/2/3 large subunit
MAQLTGGQAVVETLKAQGVDTIFGIISTHMMDIYDALYDHRDAIRFISARHEHGAALMADGYARVSGKPGICLTSTGPGAANSMGGMGEAYLASSPVLNLTSTAEEDVYRLGVGATHEVKDQLGMFTSVTQWNSHVGRIDAIPDRIYEAFERFQTRRPRPIEVEIAVDVQFDKADLEIPQYQQKSLPAPDPDEIVQAAQRLLSGKRVAILAGAGVHRSGASGELAALAETLGVPVLTTAEGKGAIPDDHALALGSHKGIPRGGDMDSDPLQQFLDGLDTLLVVGSSLAVSRTKGRGWRLPENIIHVDADRTAIGKVYDASLSVEGDAKAVLDAVKNAVQGKPAQIEAGFDREVADLKQTIQAHKQETMSNQLKVMEAIRSVTARDAIFTGDVNVATHSAANYLLPVYEPRSYLLSHWGGLGFALPAGAGAKAAFPERQVVCLTGDGGFQFNMQELGTCVQYGLNQVVMVFNDNAWGVLKQRQTTDFGGRFIGSELQNPNFARLAESYGANGIQVGTVAEMTSALEDALKSDVLTVIEVQTPDGFANLS